MQFIRTDVFFKDFQKIFDSFLHVIGCARWRKKIPNIYVAGGGRDAGFLGFK